MSDLWDPTSVLDLPTRHNCVHLRIGPRVARKRHCGMTLPKDSITRFDAVVQDMAQLAPGSEAVHALLVSLAECGLCKQLHSHQQEAMVAEWIDKIECHLEQLPSSSPRASSPQGSHAAAEQAEAETAGVLGVEGDHLAYDGQPKSANTDE